MQTRRRGLLGEVAAADVDDFAVADQPLGPYQIPCQGVRRSMWWNWYRSMWSGCSGRRLSSHALRMWSADRPGAFGRSSFNRSRRSDRNCATTQKNPAAGTPAHAGGTLVRHPRSNHQSRGSSKLDGQPRQLRDERALQG